MVDHAGHVARAEAVVDVDDRDAAGTGVQHAEQRCDPAEGGAVADAGRHRDDRAVRQSSDDRGQRALHPGDGDDAPCAHDDIQVIQQAVKPRDAHIIQAYHLVAEHLGGDGRLLRHGDVAGRWVH